MPWATVAVNIAIPLQWPPRLNPNTCPNTRLSSTAACACAVPLSSCWWPSRIPLLRRALFTAQDVALKRQMQDLVITALTQARLSTPFITYDLMEAICISHRIPVLHPTGQGIAGERSRTSDPTTRSEGQVFVQRESFLAGGSLFAHIHHTDQRFRPRACGVSLPSQQYGRQCLPPILMSSGFCR